MTITSFAEASANKEKAGILACNGFTGLPAVRQWPVVMAKLMSYLQLRDSL